MTAPTRPVGAGGRFELDYALPEGWLLEPLWEDAVQRTLAEDHAEGTQVLLQAAGGDGPRRTTLLLAATPLDEPDARVAVKGIVEIERPRTSTDGELRTSNVPLGPVAYVSDVVELELPSWTEAPAGTAVLCAVVQAYLPVPAYGVLLTMTLSRADPFTLDDLSGLAEELASRLDLTPAQDAPEETA